ncbi:hypothetical protein K0M31_000783 [Melipona bicolor]|uniref:Protein Wnt n=1 Tax=Melipona bicolor TaxID=60889 RepID=A0AA40KX61_9HYME|nr:hypothetical protein K0M31_000783 [Melipona bicolor]
MEKSLPTEGDWEWGGCGDNVKFGFKKSRDFMDAPYRKRSDIKTLVKLHNNNAGRLVGVGYIAVFHFAPLNLPFSPSMSMLYVYVYICAAGHQGLYEHRVQMPRTLGIVHGPYLLAENAGVPRRREQAERVVRRRGEGDTEQRRAQLHHGGADHQAAGQIRSDLQRGLAGLLQAEQKNRLAGHAGTTLQLHQPGSRRMRAALLRPWLRHQGRQGEDQLRM